MNLKEKMKRFDQRWNVSNKESEADKFYKLKVRILNVLKNCSFSADDVFNFSQFFGLEENYRNFNNGIYNYMICEKLSSEQDFQYFFKILEVVFTLNFSDTNPFYSNPNKISTYKNICDAIDLSDVNVSTSMINKTREIIFYSKGEKILDEDLVNSVLSFLDKKSNDHFVEALKLYSDKKWIKSAESLRMSLEEFLRVKLENKAGLKANMLEISKRLKDENSPAQARNIIVSIFNYIDTYFNEESKHRDGDLEENEAEFLIYQVALLMRYINKQIK